MTCNKIGRHVSAAEGGRLRSEECPTGPGKLVRGCDRRVSAGAGTLRPDELEARSTGCATRPGAFGLELSIRVVHSDRVKDSSALEGVNKWITQVFAMTTISAMFCAVAVAGHDEKYHVPEIPFNGPAYSNIAATITGGAPASPTQLLLGAGHPVA